MGQVDLVSVVECIYAFEGRPEAAWLGGIAASASALVGRGFPSYGLTYDASDRARIRFSDVVLHDVEEPGLARVLTTQLRGMYERSPELVDAIFRKVAFAPSLSLPAQELLVEGHALLRATGYREILGVNGVNVDGRGAHFGVCLRRPSKIAADALARLASHLAAASRLRRRLGAKEPTAEADAVIDPAGKIAHAERAAKVRGARTALAEAAGKLDRLRAAGRRRDPERALGAWKALVDGRWSLVDHFEHDGRRWVLAHRNDPATAPFELLTERERQVVALAALGHSNKMIGYELGIAISTVGVLLSRASRKVGARRRSELVAAWNLTRR